MALTAALLTFSSLALGTAGVIYVPAQPVQAGPPSVPPDAAGWVHVSFIVQIDGSVSEVIVLDSSGSTKVEQSVIEAIGRWTFRPATLNGKPVPQRLDERLEVVKWAEDSLVVRRKFNGLFKHVRKLIKSGKLDSAEMELIKARDDNTLSYESWTSVHLLLADVAAGRSEKRQQLQNLLTALPYALQVVDVEDFDNLLRSVFALQVDLKMYRAALNTYEDLKKFEQPFAVLVDLYDKGDLEQAAREVRTVVEGTAGFSVQGQITKRGAGTGNSIWDFEILRRRIAFAEVEGSLDSFEVRCASHIFSDKVNPEREWTLPTSWGACRLFVFGQPDSRFKLLQLPPVTP